MVLTWWCFAVNTHHSIAGPAKKKVRLIFGGVLERGRFTFRSQNSERPTTKRYDLYFGAKIPKGYDYSTRYDYLASAGRLAWIYTGSNGFCWSLSTILILVKTGIPRGPWTHTVLVLAGTPPYLSPCTVRSRKPSSRAHTGIAE